MHIHLDENPARPVACKSSPSMPYVSLETIADFSNLDISTTRKWVRVNEIPVHTCNRVAYVATHAILQFLTDREETSTAPAIDVNTALELLTSKLVPKLLPWTSDALEPADVHEGLRKIIKRYAILNVPCGTRIPIDGLFNFVPKATPSSAAPCTHRDPPRPVT